MSITIATVEDIPQLNQLIHSCYRGEESLKGWTTERILLDGTRTTPENLKQDLTSSNVTILKYTNEQNELIGCISADKKGDKMGAGMLCVRPDLQSQGLGRKLMNAVEDLARQKNCKVMKMDVISVRDTLIAWYERQGFRKVTAEGTRKFREVAPTEEFGVPKMPLEFIVMEKPLL